MVVGMARAAKATLSCGNCAFWRCLGALFFSLSLVAAMEVRADEPPPSLPALSAYCQVPASDIATPEPLPHLAAALEGKRTVRVLTVHGIYSHEFLTSSAWLRAPPRNSA